MITVLLSLSVEKQSSVDPAGASFDVLTLNFYSEDEARKSTHTTYYSAINEAIRALTRERGRLEREA